MGVAPNPAVGTVGIENLIPAAAAAATHMTRLSAIDAGISAATRPLFRMIHCSAFFLAGFKQDTNSPWLPASHGYSLGKPVKFLEPNTDRVNGIEGDEK
jgi:hypothetical protein